MVDMVVKAKTDATTATPTMLCSAAGTITSGISGSHGPKTNMVNNIQGVSVR